MKLLIIFIFKVVSLLLHLIPLIIGFIYAPIRDGFLGGIDVYEILDIKSSKYIKEKKE